jgi:ATP-binding cassette subfamily B (MDR/TAP) protein 1
MYVIFALIFYIGTLFVRDIPGVKFIDVFTAIYAIVFAAMTAGNNMHFMPDVAASKNSAASLFSILDEQDEDQLQEGSPMIKEGGKNGHIEIRGVTLKYAGRTANAFENLSLTINPKDKVALVGPSGCGKSTVIQMLLRFYEPDTGEILLDGRNIRDYELHYLRNLFGVVSQEPVLFNTSFRENIRYNKDEATDEAVRLAAQRANALSFIEGAEELEGKNETKDKKPDEQDEQ